MTEDKVTRGGNVITPEFGKKNAPAPVEDLCVFVCGHCQCRTFNLYDDGTIMCAYCEEVIRPEEGGDASRVWRRCLSSAATPLTPEAKSQLESEAGTVNVNHSGDTSLARRHVMKKLNDWSKDGELALVAGYHVNGASHGWFGVETEEQRVWMVEKIGDILKHVQDMIVEPDMENVIVGPEDKGV